jgi:hypothetical protein
MGCKDFTIVRFFKCGKHKGVLTIQFNEGSGSHASIYLYQTRQTVKTGRLVLLTVGCERRSAVNQEKLGHSLGTQQSMKSIK